METLDLSIMDIRKLLLPQFINKWTEHNCCHPNCKTALNFDGNHKINRLTCLYDNNYLDSPEIKSD